jgi:hypothetical protein
MACVLIAGCMIYLFKSGISVRSQTLIRPSELHGDMRPVAQAVFYRLFPEFQDRDVFVIGVDQPSERVKAFIEDLRVESETFHKNKIEVFDDENLLTAKSRLMTCSKDCWVLTETQSTSDIAPMPSVMQLAGIDERNRFTLSIFEFDSYDEKLIPDCEKQKLLTLECLKNLSIKEAQHKMRDKDKKYFFLKQYLERDYFLFLQK